jgi:dipeptidyl aminopeptidase/acylaminoacyl peptidase
MTKNFDRGEHGEHREDEPKPSHLFALAFLFVVFFFCCAISDAQDNPVLKIDDDITRFTYSTGGRIAYATRHVFSAKKIELQRDDIWICEPDGKKHRILLGEKFVRGSGPFSYTIRGLRWSPDGRKLVAELATSEMINDDGDTHEGVSTLLLDDTGREIVIAGTDSLIPGAANATWLADGAGVIYLKERASAQVPGGQAAKASSAPPAAKLFSVNRVNPLVGGESMVFQGHLFVEVTWSAKQNAGVAIERDAAMIQPPRLVALDLTQESSRLLATLEGYAGGLSFSPSGKRAAYWIDNGQLEVRDVDAPGKVTRLRVPLGTLAWSGDETRVLVKRGPANRSGGLVWLQLPPLATVAAGANPLTVEVLPQSVLHDLGFRQFDISPDGKSLAVVEPGRRNLLVYPLS